MTFYFDFGSPWAFLAATQVLYYLCLSLEKPLRSSILIFPLKLFTKILYQVAKIAQNHNAKLIYKPVLLGALFKMIGTPNVPMLATSEAKRNYGTKDMRFPFKYNFILKISWISLIFSYFCCSDWLNWWGDDLSTSFTFPSSFPIRTVQALRVAILVQKNHPHLEEKVIQVCLR